MLYGQTPKWIDWLDRRLPGFGIPNLALYLVGIQACGYLLTLANPNSIFLLMLDPSLVLKGEVWRLVTFLAVPPQLSPLWIVFALYFLYFIVNGIEEEWGEFRTTLYVLVAVLLTIAFSFAFGWPIVSASIDAFPGGSHHRARAPDPDFLRATGKDEMAGVGVSGLYCAFPDFRLNVEPFVSPGRVCELFAVFRSVFCGTAQGISPAQEVPAGCRGRAHP